MQYSQPNVLMQISRFKKTTHTLIERILDRYDRVLRDQIGVQLKHLLARKHHRAVIGRVLEVEIIRSVLGWCGKEHIIMCM
jgi:hypothetical protein